MRSGAAQISVVIPTYRRAEHLARCLRGLKEQTAPPHEILVVRRSDDDGTRQLLESMSGTASVVVSPQAVVGMMLAGARRATGNIVAFTDDDAVPRPQWIERMAELFEDDSVGGAGGRDVVHTQQDQARPLVTDVGRLTRWGRMIGNHHLGAGRPRDVMVLKGVNMAFRKAALAFPLGLQGSGTQLHFEIAMCAWARRRGWRLIYDPLLVVDHYAAPRRDRYVRSQPSTQAVSETAYNLVRSIAESDDSGRWRRAAYGLLLGDREIPGLARGLAAALERDGGMARRVLPSMAGQARGLRASRRRLSFVTLDGQAKSPPKRPVVVLVAHDIHDHGGMERAFSKLIRLAANRARFVVVSRTLENELRAGVDWRRVHLPSRPFPLAFAAFFAVAGLRLRGCDADVREVLGAIVPNRVDLVSVHFCHAAFIEKAGGLVLSGSPPLRRVNHAIGRLFAVTGERWCYRPKRLRAFAAVSAGVRDELERHYPGVPVTVTPNGVDLERFQPDPVARRTERDRAGIATQGVVALFVGGDWDRKGLKVAIEGTAYAREQGADRLCLWVVGPGDRSRFERVADASGVRDAVFFFGRVAHTERFYRAADLFVLPTLYEAHPLVVHEAAASGLPVVVTPVNGVRDIVGNAEAGLLVERTSEAVGEALRLLALDAITRRAMSNTARERAAAYTWERSVDSVLGAYGELMAGPRPAAFHAQSSPEAA